MANLRGEGALKAVPLVATFYDNAVAKDKNDPNKIVAEYVNFEVHADDPKRGKQAVPSLRLDRDDQGRSITSVSITPEQAKAIREVAGDNKADVFKQGTGEKIGTQYAVQADLILKKPEGKSAYFLPNTKTLAPTEFSVAEVDGVSYAKRAFDQSAAVRAENAAAKAAKDAEKAVPEAEVAEPVAEEPKKAPAKRASRAKAAAAPAEPAPASDEPSLG